MEVNLNLFQEAQVSLALRSHKLAPKDRGLLDLLTSTMPLIFKWLLPLCIMLNLLELKNQALQKS